MTETTGGRRVLVLGGSQSGKSRFAEQYLGSDEAVTYVATAPEYTGDAGCCPRRRPPRPQCTAGGFGAMIASSVTVSAAVAWTVVVLGIGAAMAVACSVPVGWILLPQVIAMAAAWLLRKYAGRRLGGMTGDVFGALIESATAVTLIGVALW
jgi:cobalamin synthase